jgi:hypothetical protein
MKKLPRLPEHPTLDEAAEWLTEASDEAWSPSTVLSRLLECERSEVLSDGTVRQSRVATSREVWVVVPPGEVMTDQVDGAEVVTRGGQLAYILEPIDLFVRTVLHCGEAVPNNGVSSQAGRRFHVTRSFSVRDVRIPKNDVFELLPAFDRLMFELDRGEHSDLARLVDDGAHGSVVSPTILNQSAGEQEGQEDTGYLLTPTASCVLTERPAGTDAEPVTVGSPLSRQRHQENELLRVLAELGHDPKALPKWSPTTPGVKKEARAKLPRMTEKVFDKAWERLRSSGDIADAE